MKRDQHAPTVSSSPASTRLRLLDRLRADLARLEGPARAQRAGSLPLGLAAIDARLPGGGLTRGCIHEITGPPAGDAAAAGFAAVLLGRLAADGPVVWIGPRSELYGPGLLELGLDPARLIVVRARDRRGRLWALEEVLRSPGPLAGLAEIDRLDLTQSRRLQLAAEALGVTAFLLRPESALRQASAAFTRWRVQALPGEAPSKEVLPGEAPSKEALLGEPAAPRAISGAARWAPARWQVELVRARTGQTGRWGVEWHAGHWHEIPDPLALAAGPGDRPTPAARRA